MDPRSAKTNEIVIAADGATSEALVTRILEAVRAAGPGPTGDETASSAIRIQGVEHQDYVLMALDHPLQLHVEGPLGDYALSYNRQANARIEGSVGDGVGDGMCSGALRIRGDAGIGAGVAMRGGTLAVYGSAGAHCGAAMCGGELFVRGDVGPAAAAGALGGTVVIGGDAAEGLGDSMRGAVIFIRGKTSTLGRGVREIPLRERDRLRLGLLLINAGIRGDVKEFRRIISDAMMRHEAARPRSEIDPSWR